MRCEVSPHVSWIFTSVTLVPPGLAQPARRLPKWRAGSWLSPIVARPNAKAKTKSQCNARGSVTGFAMPIAAKAHATTAQGNTLEFESSHCNMDDQDIQAALLVTTAPPTSP